MKKQEVIAELSKVLSEDEISALSWPEQLKKAKELRGATEAPKVRERIDEVSTDYFIRMGYEDPEEEGELIPGLASFFKKFKMKMDTVNPGRLSPEGYAFIALLFDLQKKGN